ncbi:nucleotidyltransferase family protein [Pontibacter liquoris]|uniref:nucleotidyltransferase family protein n=1 Tax=Pontibacter liquoris TaxID=2905677 RepID=UPI001FA6D514|nr:NTP transferase domain-containing protein [Pontibacter liquoris]
MQKPSLLILAAGMATRYGGLKQLEPFGPNGETIIDYSVYDALRAGFGKVILVIREAMEAEFKKGLLHRLPANLPVTYVFQELDVLPPGYSVPPNRLKPWGTGHAVWVAAPKVQEPFAVLNGDDFYGYESFQLAADFLLKNKNEHEYALAGYQLANTLSENGPVSRGICALDEAGYLTALSEYTHIARTPTGIMVQDPGSTPIRLQGDEIVSMNLMAFKPTLFPYLTQHLETFLQENSDNPKAELYLPKVVNALIQAGDARVKVLPTPEKWFGVTYPEDKTEVIRNLANLIQAGVYPANLWGTASVADL